LSPPPNERAAARPGLLELRLYFSEIRQKLADSSGIFDEIYGLSRGLPVGPSTFLNQTQAKTNDLEILTI